MKRNTVFCALLVITSGASGASFDCAKASTGVEKLICETQELSLLDSEMARLYKSTKRSKDEKHIQSLWLNERNECDSAECLISSYQDRIAELRGVFERGAIYDVVLENGDHETLVLPYSSSLDNSELSDIHVIQGYVKQFTDNKFVVAMRGDDDTETNLAEGELSSDRSEGKGVWSNDGKEYHKFVMTRKITYLESNTRCENGRASKKNLILGNQDFEKRVQEMDGYCEDGQYWENTSIEYMTDDFLSLRGFASSFEEGMAHPSHGSAYENYIISDNRYTQVKLSHFVVDTPECKQKLSAALFAKLTDCHLEAENGHVSDSNFSPTSDGIKVLFHPYEVGPYAAGEPEIFLNSDSLKGCLKNLPNEAIYMEPGNSYSGICE